MASPAIAKTITRENDFQGLEQIWPPVGSEIPTRFDLVFVHGLTGDSLSTWTHENGQCWINWLIEEVPDIRVYAFGYRSEQVYFRDSLRHEEGKSRTFNVAGDLCNSLRDDLGRLTNPNPLTLIAHGVGGIVVKNVLLLCNALPTQYRQILDDVHHVMFLDTPHHGMETDAWLEVFGMSATQSAAAQLNMWSESLVDILKYFGDVARDKQITSVYSTVPVSTANGTTTVVQESSAALGTPNETHVHLQGTDHVQMGKFHSRKQLSYRQLRDRIAAEIRRHREHSQALANETSELNADIRILRQRIDEVHADSQMLFTNATRAQSEPEQTQKDKLKKKMLKWLMPKEQSIDPTDDLQRTEAFDGTCTWIFDVDEYQEWSATCLSKVLWIHGIQGCGKSTLVATMSRLHSQEDARVFNFFFPPESSFSTAYALSCITYQMLHESEAVLEALQSKYEKTKASPSQSVSAARAVLKIAITAFGDCTVFIDALDNCADRRELLNTLSEITTWAPYGVKLCCSSRDEHDFIRGLLDKPWTLHVQINEANLTDDMAIFIRETVERDLDLMEKLAASEGSLEHIITTLNAAAQGMFLLPKYFVEDLSTMPNVSRMLEFLKDLPTDLHDYYLKIVSNMDTRWVGLARSVFTWTAWARRPLSLPEMEQIFSLKNEPALTLSTDIKRALGCLITIKDNRVVLSHDSVRRFIRDSPLFRSSSVYSKLVPKYPEDEMMEACIELVFNPNLARPPSQTKRFAVRDPESLRAVCPFMEYACINWIFHWSLCMMPLRFLPAVASFFSSGHALVWVECTAHFMASEGLGYILSILRRTVGELRAMSELMTHESRDLEPLRMVADKIALLDTFTRSWDAVILSWPREIRTFSPLIDGNVSLHPLQATLITRNPQLKKQASLYNSLDSFPLPRGYDRFFLCDLNLFMWRSLMPSHSWDMFYRPLNPGEAAIIELSSISLHTARMYLREGIDLAEIGSMTASTAFRKDFGAVAIAWARFDNDKSRPLMVKTYAWELTEDPESALLHPYHWTYLGDDDPCRVDMTPTHAFRKSKCAVAFTDDMKTLWTAGGHFNLRDGQHGPAPPLFKDNNVQGVTFATDASIVACIRNTHHLQMYSVPRFTLVTAYKGNCEILGVSNLGSFTIFLERTGDEGSSESPSDATSSTHRAVCLLSKSGNRTVLWTDEIYNHKPKNSPGTSPARPGNPISLEKFYNHGGLHAFSPNDAVLVLCVPGRPDWELLAFDLLADDIQRSAWNIEYSFALAGAAILSISFCPQYERRIYVLDNFSIMRSFEIARAAVSKEPKISTIDSDDALTVCTLLGPSEKFPVFTVANRPEKARHTAYSTPGMELLPAPSISYKWSWRDSRLGNYCQPCFISAFIMSSLRATVQSATLIADISPVMAQLKYYDLERARDLERVWKTQQERIGSCITSIQGYQKKEESEFAKVASRTTPWVNTSVTFDDLATLAFFHHVMYLPYRLDDFGRPVWGVVTTLDIHWTESHRQRRTSYVEVTMLLSKEKEALTMAFHRPTKKVVYTTCIRHHNMAKDEHWTTCCIVVCCLQASEAQHGAETTEEGLSSRKLSIDCGFIETLLFSNCGNYVYGYTSDWPGSIVQLDVRFSGSVVRQIHDPFRAAEVNSTSLTWYEGELHAAAVVGISILLLRFRFDESQKYDALHVAACPIETGRYDKLTLRWPQSKEGNLSMVCHGTNYLRREGSLKTEPLWPMVFSVPLGSFSDWITLDERDKEDYFPAKDEPIDSNAKTETPTETGSSRDALAAKSEKSKVEAQAQNAEVEMPTEQSDAQAQSQDAGAGEGFEEPSSTDLQSNSLADAEPTID